MRKVAELCDVRATLKYRRVFVACARIRPDYGLALTLGAQLLLRQEMRVLVMSGLATMSIN